MTAVTDHHSAYFTLHFLNHQVCLAHLLRECQYLNGLDKLIDENLSCLNERFTTFKINVVIISPISSETRKYRQTTTHLSKEYEN
ncbi:MULTISPECIES: transposase [Bacteroidaceae]|uniref:transposase n=1 Tax=Bacteroidaceae TaxID=815 RepID=UPI00242A5EE0|nr:MULTISPECIES: transposase [Bacteroidaceae]